jgi:Pyruvate/2-oxoacid:ferredoxin oxidoreductase delta subunit
MIFVNDRLCPQTHRCPTVASCSQGAIVQASILSAPRIDYDLCTDCRICTKACRVFQYVPEEAAVTALFGS